MYEECWVMCWELFWRARYCISVGGLAWRSRGRWLALDDVEVIFIYIYGTVMSIGCRYYSARRSGRGPRDRIGCAFPLRSSRGRKNGAGCGNVVYLREWCADSN